MVWACPRGASLRPSQASSEAFLGTFGGGRYPNTTQSCKSLYGVCMGVYEGVVFTGECTRYDEVQGIASCGTGLGGLDRRVGG